MLFAPSASGVVWLEGEKEAEGVVDGLHLCGVQSAGRIAEPLRVDDGGLLYEYAGGVAE